MTPPTTPFMFLIRRYLAAGGLSQRELAQRVNVSHNQISLICRGARAPQAALARRLAAYLRVPVRDLPEFLVAAKSAKAHRHQSSTDYVAQVEADLQRITATMGRVRALLEAIAPLLPKSSQAELASLLKDLRLA